MEILIVHIKNKYIHVSASYFVGRCVTYKTVKVSFSVFFIFKKNNDLPVKNIYFLAFFLFLVLINLICPNVHLRIQKTFEFVAYVDVYEGFCELPFTTS